MAEGSLKVFVYTGKQTIPIENAEVTLIRDGATQGIRLTDSSGLAGPFKIETPPFEESLAPQNTPPYAIVDLTIHSPGFITTRYNGIRVFPDRESAENVELVPLPEGRRESSIIYNLNTREV